MAPSLGLYLGELFFDGYNAKQRKEIANDKRLAAIRAGKKTTTAAAPAASAEPSSSEVQDGTEGAGTGKGEGEGDGEAPSKRMRPNPPGEGEQQEQSAFALTAAVAAAADAGNVEGNEKEDESQVRTPCTASCLCEEVMHRSLSLCSPLSADSRGDRLEQRPRHAARH